LKGKASTTQAGTRPYDAPRDHGPSSRFRRTSALTRAKSTGLPRAGGRPRREVQAVGEERSRPTGSCQGPALGRSIGWR
jgi:hypothetical protein